jgi:acetyl-CoA synthetase
MDDHYQALYDSFRWRVPTQFNIAQLCCHRWAANTLDARRIAIYYEDKVGHREVWTYERLATTANQLAHGLVKMGIRRGDRVAVILGQRPETLVAHMAIYSVGAVVLPLSTRLGAETLETQLRDADARVAIVDECASAALLSFRHHCRSLQQIIGIHFADERILPWRSLLARQPTEFKLVSMRPSDPALLLYTTCAIGRVKGALLPHSVLIGTLPGFVASQDWFPRAGDILWTPADWASPEGIMNALLPTLYFGHPLVGTCGDFHPERAYNILERYQVTNAFLTPTALKSMMKAVPEPRQRYRLALRSLMSLGEKLEENVFEWGQTALGVATNEMFGRTEINYPIGNSSQRWPPRPGSLGRPYPGHQVAVIDAQGKAMPRGKIGEIALNRYDITGYPDPALFLGYWRNEQATVAKFTGDWYRTGELASVDRDGYFWSAGRPNEILESSTYPIASHSSHSLCCHGLLA